MTDENGVEISLRKVSEAEATIRNRFKASDVSINTDEQSIRLEFTGFDSLEAALERVSDVASDLADHGDVHAGVNSEGVYDPHEDEMDERPMAWVNVKGVNS